MPALMPFGMVLLLSAVQFFSDRINIERSTLKGHISSFAAAIAITYLLFNFLPEAYKKSEGLVLFFPLILGFALIHLLEKFFYKKYSSRFSLKKAKTYHDELHAVVLFIYHFVIGAVLIGILETNLVSGLLFMPPLLMFTTIGNWSLHHAYLQQIPHRRLLLASSTVFGALFAKSAAFSPLIGNLMVNFTAGILLFVVVRESIPQPKEGNPFLFVLGIALYGAMLFFLHQMPY
ncbi:hypothetical protein J4470_04675 [Candidatus Woesearchaeota archaeon]|nr:hypothetical protein [Candidatus Woesearchaeota archaeon]